MQIVEIDHQKVLTIMKVFEDAQKDHDALRVGFCTGISTTLDLLGIRIDGVNWYPSNDEDGDAE